MRGGARREFFTQPLVFPLRMRTLLALAGVSAASGQFNWCQSAPQSSWTICDMSASISDRTADIVSRLTIADKIQALNTGTPSLPSINLPAYNWWSEATHGATGGRRGGRRGVMIRKGPRNLNHPAHHNHSPSHHPPFAIIPPTSHPTQPTRTQLPSSLPQASPACSTRRRPPSPPTLPSPSPRPALLTAPSGRRPATRSAARPAPS